MDCIFCGNKAQGATASKISTANMIPDILVSKIYTANRL